MILLLVLAAAAGGAAYWLYLRPTSDEGSKEVAVRARPQGKGQTVQPRLTQKLMPPPAEQAAEPRTQPTPAEATPGEQPASPARPPEPAQEAEPSRIAAALQAKQKEDGEKPPSPPSEDKAIPPAEMKPEPARPALETDTGKATPSETAKAGPAAETAPVARTYEPKASKPKAGRIWVVNALSTQDPEKARQLLDSFMSLPYRVYAYQTEIRGQNWYRIRVGFFETEEEARVIGEQLSKKYQLPPPWLVRPGKKELDKYYHRRKR